jgi:murein L,D-transpeptidase YafK
MTVWAALALLASAAAPVACPHAGNSVVVDAATRVLVLCEAGSPTRTFGVHLGRGGVGKRTAGDEKVPLGMFELGVPRHSEQFGTFIPIAYPTAEQRKAGYTGDGVGVHGPHRYLRWLGPLNNVFASTAGCVGVASDDEIDAIARWVTANHVGRIEIR